MKGSSYEQFLVLKKNEFFIIIFLRYIGMTVEGAWQFEQNLYPISTVGLPWNLVKIGQVVSEEKLFNNVMTLYINQHGQGKIILAE